MKKAAFFLMFFYLLSISFSGCGNKNTSASTYRAVTAVDIVTQRDSELIHRHYTSPEKMQGLLTILRLLKPQGKPDMDPEYLTKDMFLIALTLSDGSRVYYRQTDHRYFSKNDQDWFCIDPAQAAWLYQLMSYFPSDPDT